MDKEFHQAEDVINSVEVKESESLEIAILRSVVDAEKAAVSKYTSNLGDMIARVDSEPKQKMVYPGIKQYSVGFIFGSSKSGKTIFCENLAMSIAAGTGSYLGKQLDVSEPKVLFISLEEFYGARTERNKKQVEKLSGTKGKEWLKNYIVVTEEMPRYLATEDDWKIISDIIQTHKPSTVFIDSLTRMYEGGIEDSQVATEVMKKLRELSTINLRLNSISIYFEFLKVDGTVTKNPARLLRIKGKAKTVIQNPLTYDELEYLYNSYKAIRKQSHVQDKTDVAHQRNTVIVSLLIWQGLHSGELEKLEVSHINLSEGIIYIPSTSRSNSRELKLHVQQMLIMHTYIHGGIRDKLKPKDEELFTGHIRNQLNLLIEELKGINPAIKNAAHIRASVILYWLRQYNKRQVQYMAGHKYITSTEMYVVQELETLTDALSKHHPFG